MTTASAPRILTIDIETSPNLAHVWRIFQENVGISQIIDATEVLCFAAKWHGEKKVEYYSQHKDGKEGMIKAAHSLLNEADVVVHYNGKRFDVPHLNREFLLLGLNPPAPYRQVDLLQIVRQRFKFTSNKLDFVASQLGLGEKLHAKVDHSLWVNCMANDPKAWKIMEKYNKQDVRLTETLLDRLRFSGWLGSQFNMAIYSESDFACPNCTSTNLKREGIYHKLSFGYQRYSCPECGTWSHDKKNIVTTRLRAATP